MGKVSPSLQWVVPSNKFYPPHINASQSILRSHLLKRFASAANENSKIVAIEAQAGQGKTTLAYQFITHYGHKHIWYQVGREDSDPVLLLSSLLHSLHLSFKDFSSPQLYDIINKGEIKPQDLPGCANILLSDMDRQLDDTFFIVFDDLHLIAEAALTNSLISYLIDTSPPKLHFLLTSRHPFELKSRTFRNTGAVSYLTTGDLALNSTEIETLFNDIYERSITIAEVKRLEEMTRGWAMGVALMAHPLKNTTSKNKEKPLQLFDSAVHKNTLSYFSEEIFAYIPENLHIPFLKLSCLDEIDIDLAEKITGVKDISIILTELTQENLFIYNLDEDFTVFRFHHLFQEFLQRMANEILSQEQIQHIYLQAASFFTEKNLIAGALSYYRQACDYKKMDELLRQYGLDLLAQNRTMTLLGLLQKITHETLQKHGWLMLFSGILHEGVQPLLAMPLLEEAQQIFIRQKDDMGELICLAETIYYHLVVSGSYKTGAKLLPRTEELLLKHHSVLSLNVRIMVMRNLGGGFCFFSTDMTKARHYIDTAWQLTVEHSIHNFTASAEFVKAYIEIHTGNVAALQQELEFSSAHINDPLVSLTNKFILRVLLICSLSMYGDLTNFFRQQKLVRDFIDEKVVRQTVAGPYFTIWNACSLISTGKEAEALELISRGLDSSATAKTEHMLSQLLQLQAFAHAIQGNTKLALTEIAEASRLRKIAGGPFYQAFNYILAGTVYGLCHKKNITKDCFAKGLQLAEKIPSPYLIACGLLQRCLFKLNNYGESAAIDDLKDGLRTLRENGYSYFWSWRDTSMLKLLQLAVRNDIERDFCKNLAAKRMQLNIEDNGETFPLLQINTLESFSVSINGDSKIPAEEFTRSQRELLGLLLVSNEKKLDQEKIQLILWPDSDPTRSRQKFDTLLGRLRKTMRKNLAPSKKDYISLNKGILCLEHTISDLEIFFYHCKKGFAHFSNNLYWQAENQFAKAFSLWKGSLPSDAFTNEKIYEFENHLLTVYEKASLQWATILEAANRETEAIPILSKLLDTNTLSEQGVLQLCQIYTKTYQPLKLKETLDRYAEALKNAEYAEEEIVEILRPLTINLGNVPS